MIFLRAFGLMVVQLWQVCLAREPSPQVVTRLLAPVAIGQIVDTAVRSVLTRPSYWQVQVDTTATQLKNLGLCRASRVNATIKYAGRSPEAWAVVETERVIAIGVLGGLAGCEEIPHSQMVSVTQAVELKNVRKLLNAVEEINRCAMSEADCRIQMIDTPREGLDRIAELGGLPAIYLIDKLPGEFSGPGCVAYNVEFVPHAKAMSFNAVVYLRKDELAAIQFGELAP